MVADFFTSSTNSYELPNAVMERAREDATIAITSIADIILF